MKLKLTNKKRAIQIGAFGVILVFVLGLVLNSNFSQAKAEMVNVNVDGTIKILEVGPGNLSRLADGIGTYTKTADGKNYTVTYMSMPEYISGIDDIAGKYDIVAITNKNDNLDDKFTNANVKDKKYTKYSVALQEKMSRLRYAAGNYGGSNYGDSLSQKNYCTDKTSDYKEFYSENDITDKRANSILDMAKRGQVVYVENSALIDGSKLKQKFESATNVNKTDEVKINELLTKYEESSKRPEISNFKVSSDDSNLTVGEKSTRKLTFAFDYDDAPDNFVVKVYVDYNADGIFKEYQSGSGYKNELIFTKALSKNTIGKTYEVQTSIDSSFIGYLDWKVEVYAGDDAKAKTSITSNFKFKKLTADKSGAVELNVLQVYPDTMNMFNDNGDYTGTGNYKDVGGLVLSNKAELSGYNDGTQGIFNNGDGTITIKQKSSASKLYIAGTFNSWKKQEINKNGDIYEVTLNLSEVGGKEYKFFEEPNNWYSNSGNTHVKGNDKNSYIYTQEEYNNASINTQSKKFQEFLNAVDDYSITVDSIPVTEFNTNCNDASKKIKMQDYDMIIIGFGDSYGGSYDFNRNAVDVIQTYIDSKAIMLSHDTISLNINEPLTTEANGSNAKGTTLFTNALKSQVGQSRYSNDEITVNGKKYASYGQTLYSVRDWSSPTKEGQNFYEQSKTKTVREVSQAQITEYPYNLSDAGISTGKNVDGQNAINISQTHTQWYQLDLENEDISPWFNLVADGSLNGVPAEQFNSGDARNFYYTYSIGNITYSGTGHTSNYTDSELKLFVNTIIRAARSSKTSTLNFVTTTTDASTDINNPTKVAKINSDFVVNFSTTGTIKEIIVKNNNTTVKESPFNGEVVNKYTTVVYNKSGEVVDIATGVGSGEESGLTPKYTIPATTLEILSQNGYILAITPTVTPKNVNSYDSVTSSTCTAYVTAEAPELLSVKHGMITDGDASQTGISKIETGCPEVEYYTSIPFEAQISGLKLYTNKTIELVIDKNFLLDEDFSPKVYSVSDNGLTVVEVKSNKEKQKDGTTKVTMELGELQSSEVIVRYEARTMAQPEQTTEVDENGINISVGENVTYQNTIKVTSETSKSANASVQVGRVVLDRPLF